MLQHEYSERVPSRNLHFILGTMKAHPQTFIIIGLLRSPVGPNDLDKPPGLFRDDALQRPRTDLASLRELISNCCDSGSRASTEHVFSTPQNPSLANVVARYTAWECAFARTVVVRSPAL